MKQQLRSELETKKEAAERELVLNTFQGKSPGVIPTSSNNETPMKKHRADIRDAMVEIGIALRESECARIFFESENLTFEREKNAFSKTSIALPTELNEQKSGNRELTRFSRAKALFKESCKNGKQVQSVMSLVTILLQNQNHQK